MTSTKKAAVSLLKGVHITAADKRNIVEGIEYLRQTFAPYVEALPAMTPDYAAIWIKRGKSAKRYSIAPNADGTTYSVTIRENYRTDAGEMRQRDMAIMVQIVNLAPLHQAAAEGVAA
jgi:hypothetical protein